MPNVELVDELDRLEVARLTDVATRATAAQGAKADAAVPSSALGVSVATLVAGVVPSSQLPSYVDDVIEVANYAALPATGESGKIYVTDVPYTSAGVTSSQFRWGGSAYAPIIASPGTTDAVTEGAVNKYFSAALARLVALATLTLTNAAIVVGDTYEAMFGKLQAQINALTAAVTASAKTCIPIACSDETTALTAGTGKVTFRMPFAMTGVTVRASLTTPQTSGSLLTIDVKEGGASIFSTKPTFDNTEKTTATAATPAVVSDTSLAEDAEITIDISQIGDGTAKGLKVYILGNK